MMLFQIPESSEKRPPPVSAELFVIVLLWTSTQAHQSPEQNPTPPPMLAAEFPVKVLLSIISIPHESEQR